MLETLATKLFLLICSHAVCDFALQTEWVATNKNRHVRLRFTKEQNEKFQVIWPWLLTAHSMIHGLGVYLVCGSLYLGLAEVLVHWSIDFGKNESWYGFHTDQILHVISKLIWVGVMMYSFPSLS